jgi:putative acetyltransferase
MAEGMRIVRDDLTHPAVLALLDLHVREAHANSPANGVFALDLTGLQNPAVTLWSAWDGETLLGLGALKELDETHGELKSMRTAPDQLRRGVAAAMLAHLIAEARARGYRRLSLETGTNDAFAPASALYEAVGFAPSGPFGNYKLTDFNRCYTLALH